MGMNETIKAISDPVRRDILQMLKSGKKSAGEIGDKFNLTGATVSSKAITRGVNSAVAFVTGADVSSGATEWGG